jgi:Zn-finger nucleic acid-binding protein/ribosomal protein L40E
VRLVACPECHRQYDVTRVGAAEIRCACGATVRNEAQEAVAAQVRRCGSCGAGVPPDAQRCEYCHAEVVREQHRLSLICPECFARNEEKSRYCTACGVAFDPQPVAGDGHEYPCPDCGCLMPPRAVGDIPVNECPSCNGVWVQGDRFERLVARAVEAVRKAEQGELPGRAPRRAGANPAAQAVRYRKCPVCDAYMQRRNYRKCSGIILDRCAKHGTWLDADELEEIAGFILEKGGVPPEPRLEPRPAPPPPRSAYGATFSSTTELDRSVGSVVLGLLASLLD